MGIADDHVDRDDQHDRAHGDSDISMLGGEDGEGVVPKRDPRKRCARERRSGRNKELDDLDLPVTASILSRLLYFKLHRQISSWTLPRV
jgi:hypothetical protein